MRKKKSWFIRRSYNQQLLKKPRSKRRKSDP